MREHFVDELPKFTNVAGLKSKLDDYEAARNKHRNVSETKPPNNENRRRFSQNVENKSFHRKNNFPQNNKNEKIN